jgi:predicted nucleic acid-binding protein
VTILLDSDILIDVLRRYEPALGWLETVKEGRISPRQTIALEEHSRET